VDPWEGDIANPVSLNKYLYGYANPLIYIDPDGRQSMSYEASYAYVAQGIKDPEERARYEARAKIEVARHEAEGGKALGQVALFAVPGTLVAKGAWAVGRTAYGAWRMGGWRLAAYETAGAQAAAVEIGAGTVAAVTGAELPPTPLSPVLQGARLNAQLGARALDAELDALQPVLRQADEVPSIQLARAADQQGLPTIVVEGRSGEPVSRMPAWLRERFKAGDDFNRRQAAKYPYNEVYVEPPCAGDACLRLDSYNPRAGEAGEIVSRKYTQLAEIQPQTASNYLRELEHKYPPGTIIADVPSNRAPSNGQPGIAGQRLRGQMYLEVPTQNAPVPQTIIEDASRRRIIIRDEDGNEY
jgi:hypothetical protein